MQLTLCLYVTRYFSTLYYIFRAAENEDDAIADITKDIRDLRQYKLDIAASIGLKCYNEYALITRMAKSEEKLKTMYSHLAKSAKKGQEMELVSSRRDLQTGISTVKIAVKFKILSLYRKICKHLLIRKV